MSIPNNYFPSGTYLTTISNVYFGFAKSTSSPYIAIQFETMKYDYKNKFYLKGGGISFLKSCLKCLNLSLEGFDVDEIRGQQIIITFDSQIIESDGIKYTRVTIEKFDKVGEYNGVLNNDESEENNTVKDNYDSEIASASSMAEIFGCDVEDVADAMGIDPSEVTEEDVRTYNGY